MLGDNSSPIKSSRYRPRETHRSHRQSLNPDEVLETISELGRLCRKLGIWVRSGHAAGADYAWEIGAREKTIVYLPRPDFNRREPLLTPHVSSLLQGTERGPKRFAVPDTVAVCRGRDAMTNYHPTGHNPKTELYHIRNYFQVMGSRADEQPVGAVVYWAPESLSGIVEGGTGQAVRIARARGIPTLNLAKVEVTDISRRLRAK